MNPKLMVLIIVVLTVVFAIQYLQVDPDCGPSNPKRVQIGDNHFVVINENACYSELKPLVEEALAALDEDEQILFDQGWNRASEGTDVKVEIPGCLQLQYAHTAYNNALIANSRELQIAWLKEAKKLAKRVPQHHKFHMMLWDNNGRPGARDG